MRKLILITAMVLVSGSAQAGERSLSLGGGPSLPAAASSSVTTAGKVANAPAVPAVEAPQQPQAPVQQADVQPSAAFDARPAGAQRATAHRSSHHRHARRWTEDRIIGEPYRDGIYR